MQVTAEYGSIIATVYTLAGLPIGQVYYDQQTENYKTPALHVPAAEQLSGGFTQSAYKVQYAAYFKIFAATTHDAMELGEKVLHGIQQARNKIAERDISGNLTGKFFRAKDVRLAPIDAGVAQLSVEWQAAYNYATAPGTAVGTYILTIKGKGG